MFYRVTVVVSPPAEIWETIEMSTMIGHSISRTVSIYNPLEIKDTFTVNSLKPKMDKYLTVEPSIFDIQPKEHVSCIKLKYKNRM